MCDTGFASVAVIAAVSSVARGPSFIVSTRDVPFPAPTYPLHSRQRSQTGAGAQSSIVDTSAIERTALNLNKMGFYEKRHVPVRVCWHRAPAPRPSRSAAAFREQANGTWSTHSWPSSPLSESELSSPLRHLFWRRPQVPGAPSQVDFARLFRERLWT